MDEPSPPPIPPLPQPPLKPTTTAEQDLGTESQRHINRIWERTQQIIAIVTILAALHLCGWVIIYGGADMTLRQSAFIFVTNISFMIIATYFQRTNHIKVGGISNPDASSNRNPVSRDIEDHR